MGCSNGKRNFTTAGSPASSALIDVGGKDDPESFPTLLAGGGAVLRKGSNLAQKGSASLLQGGAKLVTNSSASLMHGGANVMSKGGSMLNKMDPRRLAGSQGSNTGSYLNVDETESDNEKDAPASPQQRGNTCRCCLWLSAGLVWAACMSAAAFFAYVGVLPAILGNVLTNAILVALASPVLIPVLKCLLPFLQRKINEMRGSNCYIWCCFIALWCALALLFRALWDLGVMQVVIGVMFSQVITVVLVLLAVIPCLAYALPMIVRKVYEFPGYVKAKLWEIPPLILPLFENMIRGLLAQMEERILEKLKDMPKDVAKAVTRIGGAATDMGAKGLKKARSAGSRGLSKMKSRSSANLGDSDESSEDSDSV